MKLRAALIALPAALLLAACGGSTDTDDAVVETTTTVAATTSTAATTSAPASTSASALTTTALDPRCTAAPSGTVTLVDTALVDDVHLQDPWTVEGEGVTYVAGNIHDAAGERVSSADVWALSDGVLYSLSSDARERSVAVDGRSILGISAGDEYGSLVQNCVATSVRNRNIESRGN
ncbi:hypothetical protein [Rhodococcus sp. NPDC058639]|uniref:hypothetical protein n=1 Tax=Rhodococcus sp. NPDC058639 TaxID=3346570 RepID=UPI00365C17D5